MPKANLVALSQGVNQEDVGEILAAAYSQCYQKRASLDTVLRHLKHQSVLEHVSFTFHVEMSRVCWAQLVRHRIASYTGQYHRYTEISSGDMITNIPPEVSDLGEEALAEWCDDAILEYMLYKKWLDRGVSKESARYLIGMGVNISAVATFNFRSLINMLSLRSESHAQSEIQELAKLLWKELENYIPKLLYQEVQDRYFPYICPIGGSKNV